MLAEPASVLTIRKLASKNTSNATYSFCTNDHSSGSYRLGLHHSRLISGSCQSPRIVRAQRPNSILSKNCLHIPTFIVISSGTYLKKYIIYYLSVTSVLFHVCMLPHIQAKQRLGLNTRNVIRKAAYRGCSLTFRPSTRGVCELNVTIISRCPSLSTSQHQPLPNIILAWAANCSVSE